MIFKTGVRLPAAPPEINMKYVYAVGVLELDESPDARKWIKADRLWYIFATFEDAEACVLQNQSDIFEFRYDYALIEKTRLIGGKNDAEDTSDVEESKQREWWYCADYSKGEEVKTVGGMVVGREPLITACEKPKILKNIVHFWSS